MSSDQVISADQIDFYNEQGYLVVESLFDRDRIETMRREVESMVEASAAITESDDVYDLEDSHTSDAPRVRRIKGPEAVMPTAGALMRDPALVGVLTALMGPDVRFQTGKLNMKSAGFGAPVEWHQDWTFYPHTNQNLLAAGIMLDDVDAENGPLLVLPGSHRGPVYDHHHDGHFCGAFDPTACGLDLSGAVPIVGPAGSVSFHHVRMVHGSALNRSARGRRFLLFQYTAVDAWPLLGGQQMDLDAYDAKIVAGSPTTLPRLEAVPVRLPLPPAPHQGSIYENQKDAGGRYFEAFEQHPDATPMAHSA